MKKAITLTLLTTMLALQSLAHCQIPCGIYDDAARFTSMREHVKTIEKSMKEITKLSIAEDGNGNQLVRWVNNKEEHAEKLAEIMTYYFLAQRIKPTEPIEKYQTELKLIHGIILSTMKAKQTVDLQHVETLRKLIDELERVYTNK